MMEQRASVWLPPPVRLCDEKDSCRRPMKRTLPYRHCDNHLCLHFCYTAFLFLGCILKTGRVDGWLSSNVGKRTVPSYALRSMPDASMSWEEVYTQRWQQQIAVLRAKDRASTPIAVPDLKIVYEDEDIIVVDKPAGILCLPSEDGVPSIAETVFSYVQQQQSTNRSTTTTTSLLDMDQMVVHRLGFETAGLLVLAKTIPAVRGLHTLFRMRPSPRSIPSSRENDTNSNTTRFQNPNDPPTEPLPMEDDDDRAAPSFWHLGIVRQYEVLVVGHVANRTGWINLPLMRCYEHPPYMRVSTPEHQQFLLTLDASAVGKKLLEAPKHSLTHYDMVAYEYWQDNATLPVTRLTLTSMTGRTHQLNVHCAAMGHPIVRDTVYGYQGTAAPHGGLPVTEGDDATLPAALAEAARDAPMCVHAKYMRFPHPITGVMLEFRSAPAF